MTALEFLLLTLATYRITRLVATDSLWADSRDRLRAWLENRGDPDDKFGPYLTGQKLAELITCPFCVGFWVSCAVLGFALGAELVRLPWQWAIIVAWSIAGAQALCSSIDGKLNEEH